MALRNPLWSYMHAHLSPGLQRSKGPGVAGEPQGSLQPVPGKEAGKPWLLVHLPELAASNGQHVERAVFRFQKPGISLSWDTSSKSLNTAGPQAFSHWDLKADEILPLSSLSPAMSGLPDICRGLWSPGTLPRAQAKVTQLLQERGLMV